jgi:hypothetical protein
MFPAGVYKNHYEDDINSQPPQNGKSTMTTYYKSASSIFFDLDLSVADQ